MADSLDANPQGVGVTSAAGFRWAGCSRPHHGRANPVSCADFSRPQTLTQRVLASPFMTAVSFSSTASPGGAFEIIPPTRRPGAENLRAKGLPLSIAGII